MKSECRSLEVQSKYGVARELLAPILYGKTVCLSVKDNKMVAKSRVKNTYMFLSLTKLEDVLYLLASVPAYGSELIPFWSKWSVNQFMRVGLSAPLSSALIKALNVLKKEVIHGYARSYETRIISKTRTGRRKKNWSVYRSGGPRASGEGTPCSAAKG